MNAPIDKNFVKTALGVWCVDGVTTIPIAIDPATGAVQVDTVSTISFSPEDIAPRDENAEPVLLAESSVDGSAIPVYVNADGAILIDY